MEWAKKFPTNPLTVFLLAVTLYSHPLILLNGHIFSSSMVLKDLECLVTESMQFVACQQWKRIPKGPWRTTVWNCEAVIHSTVWQAVLGVLAKWLRKAPMKLVVRI